MACGHVVELGSAGRTAALMRILRGTKPAGTAAAGRRQYFYIALLWDDEWLYATIPNISNTFKRLEDLPSSAEGLHVICCIKKERKKTDNPREGWEHGTPPPHRDFKERCVVR